MRHFDLDALLSLTLYIGPGPAEARRRLIELATTYKSPYRVSNRAAGKNQKWKSIYSLRFLKPEDYEDAALGDIEARIQRQWREFAARDLPALVAPIQEAAASIAASLADDEATSEATSGLANEAVQDR